MRNAIIIAIGIVLGIALGTAFMAVVDRAASSTISPADRAAVQVIIDAAAQAAKE